MRLIRTIMILVASLMLSIAPAIASAQMSGSTENPCEQKIPPKKTNVILAMSYCDNDPDKGNVTQVYVGTLNEFVRCNEIDKSNPKIARELATIKQSCKAKITSNYSSQRYHTARVPSGLKQLGGGYIYASPDGKTTFKRDRWNGRTKLKMTKMVDGELVTLKYVYLHLRNLKASVPIAAQTGNTQPSYDEPNQPVVEQPRPSHDEPIGCPPQEPCKGGLPNDECPPNAASCGKDGPLPPICDYESYPECLEGATEKQI